MTTSIIMAADIPGISTPDPDGEGDIWYVSTDGGLYHSLDALQV